MNKDNISKDEICHLVEEFAQSLGFGDVATMKQTAYHFKSLMNFSDDDSNESDVSCVSPSQDLCPRKSVCSTSAAHFIKEAGSEFEPKERKPRKSRKSVCVLPKIVLSSSEDESDEEEEEDDDQSEDSEIEIPSQKSKCRRIIKSSDETESDDNNDNVPDDNQDGFDKIKKKISYIESSEDDDLKMMSKSFSLQTITDNKMKQRKEKEVNSKQFIAGSNPVESDDSEDDSEGSLKDFIVSENEDSENNGSEDNDNDSEYGSDEENDRDYDGDFNEGNDGLLVFDNGDNDDFCEPKVFKTPLKTPSTNNARKVLQEKSFQKFLTPHSQSKKLLSEFATPKLVPGTPAYKRDFNKKRDKVIGELFRLFNKTVFGNQLPADMQITWNKRMTKTAGFCYYSKSFSTRKCRIELSDKVIDSVERVRDTLIHELCHAAAWMINGTQAGHGPCWKSWAKKANIAHPELPIISRCHRYEINTKYNYLCNGCGTKFGRHSKSIDPTKHRCGKCGGIPELMNEKSVSATPKTPNAYAQFVKENFGTIKKSNPGKPHREIMMIISEQFRESKK